MPQRVGTTRVMMSPETMAGPPGAKFMETVQKAVGGEYQLLGELGRGAKGKIVYLARERSSNRLVALQLTPAEDSARGAPEMWLEVLRQLDANVPGVESTCPRCGSTLRDWARFCGHCGADLSGVAPGASAGGADALLRAVKDAAGARYEVLGQMDRAEGGGIVYFARERATGRIVALRLQRSDGGAPGGADQYSLGVTRVISSLAESLGATYGPPTPNVTFGPPSDQGRKERGPAQPAADRAPIVTPPPVEQRTTVAPPVTQPTTSWWSVERNQQLALILGGLTLVIVLTLSTIFGRDSDRAGAAAGSGDSAAVAKVDSAEVQIGGALPEGATVSVDGRPVTGESVKLAPGSYTFRARAPGRLASTQQIELRAGQTVIWTPQLVRASRAAGKR